MLCKKTLKDLMFLTRCRDFFVNCNAFCAPVVWAGILLYILISVTNADFDTSELAIQRGIRSAMAESLVKKSNCEHYTVCLWTVASLYRCDRLYHTSVGFALLFLTREVMRDLDVWDE